MWTRVLRIPATSRLAAPDLVVVAWAVLWVAVALAVVQNTRDVAKLGGTVSQTGSAVNQIGGLIGDIPLLPSDVSGASGSVQAAGASAEVNGTEGQDAANRLGIYLGLAIAILPSVPIIGLYLPIPGSFIVGDRTKFRRGFFAEITGGQVTIGSDCVFTSSPVLRSRNLRDLLKCH